MKLYRLKIIVLCWIIAVIFAACSSAPKKPLEVDVLRTIAENWLEAGIKDAEQGKLDNALVILTNAKKHAILTDDSSLIIRVCLSRGNVLYSMNRINEAFSEWEQAVAEAERFKNTELISAAKIFLARGNLLTERLSAQALLNEVNRESANIKNSRTFIAFSWQVKGLAFRALGSFNEAEAAFRNSLEIHLKDRYLEQASYDWYSIASVRSLSGNIQGALSALESSLEIDRRIENSWGIASSYRAMGDVYRKAGRQNEALESYRRARAIYVNMENASEVADIDRRMRL